MKNFNMKLTYQRAIYIGNNPYFGYGMTGDYCPETCQFIPDDKQCPIVNYPFGELYFPQS